MERLLREETIQAIEQSDLNRLQELVKLLENFSYIY